MYALYYFFYGCSDQKWGCQNKTLSFGQPPQPGECHSPAQWKKHNRMLLIKTGTECPSRCVLFPGASSEATAPLGLTLSFRPVQTLQILQPSQLALQDGCSLHPH